MCHSIERDIDVTNLYLPFSEEEIILMKIEEAVVLFGLLSS